MRFVVETLTSLDPARAWTVVSDTDHFNRYVPLPKVHYGSAFGEGGVLRPATARMNGLTLRWTEYPFQWTEGQRFSESRVYESGPALSVTMGAELEAVDAESTLIRYFVEITPRLSTTHKVDDLLCAELGRHLAEAGDDEVLRMRPFVLADAWQRDRYQTLEMFLLATKIGLLNLEWQLMCPNCRVPKVEVGTLGKIPSSYHCELCGIAYETDLDRYTELRFTVNAEIRPVEDAVFCLGSPARSKHCLVQAFLRPGDVATVTLDLKGDAALKARVVGSNASLPVTAGEVGGVRASELDLSFDGATWVTSQAAFVPGPVRFRLSNTGTKAVLVVVENVRWDDQAVTAALVTTMSQFRDLFGSEVLAAGQQISVRNLCVLFTDLKRSTELYELVGDASAFSRVYRHFDFISKHVSENHGAIVKTIGDAVMAVFPSPLAAIKACVGMQATIDGFNEQHDLSPPLVLKAGIHAGAAIAVTANGVLDYFGRTVNLAARVQGESKGGDIVFSDSVGEGDEVKVWLLKQGCRARGYRSRLKGFDEEFTLWRIESVAKTSTVPVTSPRKASY